MLWVLPTVHLHVYYYKVLADFSNSCIAQSPTWGIQNTTTNQVETYKQTHTQKGVGYTTTRTIKLVPHPRIVATIGARGVADSKDG